MKVVEKLNKSNKTRTKTNNGLIKSNTYIDMNLQR